MRDDFAVFILTHGRPTQQKTARTLARQGYTGKVYWIVDDLDATLPEYQAIYGERVLTFDKRKVAAECDPGTNSGEMRSPLFARNACHALARSVGVRYFMQLDDDYTYFVHRFDNLHRYVRRSGFPKSLDRTFSLLLDYYIATPFTSICFSQTGDFIGGEGSTNCTTLHTMRKAMNSFLCDVERSFQFKGILNDDVNTYVESQHRGHLFLTVMSITLMQTPTQQNTTGGLTGLYLDAGTYVKSFYTVMMCPSAAKVRDMGNIDRRIHHSIRYNHCAPMIVRAEHCKRLQQQHASPVEG